MSSTLKFSLVSPESELFSGEVIHVDVPGTEGDMGIHPMHAPLMAAIRTGIINVHLSDENIKFFDKYQMDFHQRKVGIYI